MAALHGISYLFIQNLAQNKHFGCSTSNSTDSREDSDLNICESIAAENLLKV
ncbi:hypothetical protein PanWU01x14_371980 [Parasponia andersonii]|uniref:Uncharacterized protein n=1 Tax=Parasponia andersonii TaxID=3476 RepID=A0A2P5A3W6_PARAD|nr:hypothetical protein PanWU01x14_371980 [Parasponia andersonii]